MPKEKSRKYFSTEPGVEIHFIIDYHASDLSLAMCHSPTGVHSLYYRLQTTNLQTVTIGCFGDFLPIDSSTKIQGVP